MHRFIILFYFSLSLLVYYNFIIQSCYSIHFVSEYLVFPQEDFLWLFFIQFRAFFLSVNCH